jgi:hypothetical protein
LNRQVVKFIVISGVACADLLELESLLSSLAIPSGTRPTGAAQASLSKRRPQFQGEGHIGRRLVLWLDAEENL